MNTFKSSVKKSINKTSFFSPQIRFNKVNNFSLTDFNDEDGFTLVELIVVVMMIGILSSIAIPQFMTAADKAKQKEATGIVAALVKAATAYSTEYGSLPPTLAQIEEYAKFQACNDPAAGTQGGQVCKGATPVQVNSGTTFITSSGNYDVTIFLGEDTSADANQIFQVRADPNGTAYRNSGSAVMGCFNPVTSTSEVFEFSAAAASKGPQAPDFRTC